MTDNMREIARMAREARRSGLTYGQLVQQAAMPVEIVKKPPAPDKPPVKSVKVAPKKRGRKPTLSEERFMEVYKLDLYDWQMAEILGFSPKHMQWFRAKLGLSSKRERAGKKK